jgi:hypothetical protein
VTSKNNHEELKLRQKSKYITYISEKTHSEGLCFALSMENCRKLLMKMLQTTKEKAKDGDIRAIILKNNVLSTQNGNWSTFQNYFFFGGKGNIPSKNLQTE